MENQKKESKPKLTSKQKAFIKEKVENPTLSDSQAARRAGYKETTAIQGKVGKSRYIAKIMKDYFEEVGLTPEYAAKRLMEGSHAFKKSYYAHEGIVITEKTDIDFTNRRSYLELYAKLNGDLIDIVEQRNLFPTGIPFNYKLTLEDEKRVAKELGVIFKKQSKKES